MSVKLQKVLTLTVMVNNGKEAGLVDKENKVFRLGHLVVKYAHPQRQ